jgi:hypothetical protein
MNHSKTIVAALVTVVSGCASPQESSGNFGYQWGGSGVIEFEYEMGEARFAEFLRDYVETYSWELATGEAFRQLAEEHCGCDLTDLFEEWVYE